MDAQRKIRDNAMGLKAWVKELEDWEDEMKKKDEELRVGPKPNKDVGPSSLISRSGLLSETNKDPHQQLKYQMILLSFKPVKKEIEPAKEEKKKIPIEIVNKPKEVDAKEKSLEWKEKGNEAFKVGNNDKAIEYYSKSIECDPKNVLSIGNRAQAYINLQM